MDTHPPWIRIVRQRKKLQKKRITAILRKRLLADLSYSSGFKAASCVSCSSTQPCLLALLYRADPAIASSAVPTLSTAWLRRFIPFSFAEQCPSPILYSKEIDSPFGKTAHGSFRNLAREDLKMVQQLAKRKMKKPDVKASMDKAPAMEVVNLLSLDPRLHNILSYGNTILVFLGALASRLAVVELHFVDFFICFCFLAHFVRRTWEAAYVHLYSRGRVNMSDWLVEYIYYWGFATWLAFSLPVPTEEGAGPLSGLRLVGLCLWLTGQFGNFYSHQKLRQLRQSSSNLENKLVLPYGFLFDYVSCPHYFFEILSWVGFSLLCKFACCYCFAALTILILIVWGNRRHERYRKLFPKYPKQRRAVIPFFL